MEVTHDGVRLGVVLRDPTTGETSYRDDIAAHAGNWFGMLVKDLIDSREIENGLHA